MTSLFPRWIDPSAGSLQGGEARALAAHQCIQHTAPGMPAGSQKRLPPGPLERYKGIRGQSGERSFLESSEPMDAAAVKSLLEAVSRGSIDPSEALERLKWPAL